MSVKKESAGVARIIASYAAKPDVSEKSILADLLSSKNAEKFDDPELVAKFIFARASAPKSGPRGTKNGQRLPVKAGEGTGPTAKGSAKNLRPVGGDGGAS